MKSPSDRPEPHEHEFSEVKRMDRPPTQHLDFDAIKDVKLPMTADLGRTTMLVRDVLELHCGSVIQLNKTAGEPTDVFVGDQIFSKGEVVVIGDTLHIRIGDIAGLEERSEDSHLAK